MPATINLRRMSLTDLKQRHTDLVEEADELNKTLQNPQIEMSDAEVEDTEAEIQAKLEEADEIDKVIKSKEAIAGKLSRRTGKTPELPLDTKPKSIIPATCRRHIPRFFLDREIEGKRPEERAYEFGRFLMAAGSYTNPGTWHHPEAVRWARENLHLTPASKRAPDQPWNAATEGGNAGVWVPEQFSTDMINLQERYGLARQLAQPVEMTSELIRIPKIGSDVSASFLGEAVEGTDATPTDDSQVTLTARKLMSIVILSSEVNEDTMINFGDMMLDRMARGFATKEDECMWIGDGTSTYGNMTGIATELQSGTKAGLIEATGNLWTEFTLEDFRKVVAKLPDYADTGPEDNPRTTWVMHRAFFHEVVLQLLDAAGGNTINTLQQGHSGRIFMGYPVRFSNVLPKTESDNSFVASFGDHFKGVAFGDRRAYTVSMSNEATVGSVNMWSSDQMGFKATERFEVVFHSPGDGTDAGPIVGIDTKAS